ncbi:MAG: hypothetical protein AAFX94_14550 [Myxococcota bacterium]
MMSELELQRKTTTTASRPPGSLNGDAFGGDVYRPDAYGSKQVAGTAPEYVAAPPAPKSLDEITATADLKHFVPGSTIRRGWILLAVGAAAAVALGFAWVSLGSGDSPPAVSADRSPAKAEIAEARAVSDRNSADAQPEETVAKVPTQMREAPAAAVTTGMMPPPVDSTENAPTAPRRVVASPRTYEPAGVPRSDAYRSLRGALRRQLAVLDITGSAETAREFLSLDEPLDWEAHRWAARALRMNGDLADAARLYGEFAERFPTNRFSRRALQWQASLERKIQEGVGESEEISVLNSEQEEGKHP